MYIKTYFLNIKNEKSRCRKTIHKKYRRFKVDIWCKLGLKRRNNFITSLVYDYSMNAFVTRVRRYTKKRQRKSFFYDNFSVLTKRKNKRFFTYRQYLEKRVDVSSCIK